MRGTSRVAVVALVLASTVAASACDGSATPRGSVDSQLAGDRRDDVAGRYVDITADELAEMLTSKDFVLVNVHTPFAGEIDGTDLHIPYDEIGRRAAEIPGGQDARIVLYCRSGNMSAEAAETLTSAGYTGVYNLIGGMQAWQAAGR
jgi:rhodanese-related sulfurtransferase